MLKYLNSIYILTLGVLIYMLSDEIPGESLAICYFCLALKLTQIKLPKLITTFVVLALMVILGFYQLNFFGYTITTEAMVTFMVGLVCIRLVQKPNELLKSDVILTFLVIAGASLFHSTLTFIIISFSSFFLATLILQRELLESLNASSIRNIVKLFAFILPITTALFFFFPRFRSFFPSAGQNYRGIVGYSTELNNSRSGNLKASDRVAFFAELPQMARDQMYWRGRSLSYTDGYNWRMGNEKNGRVSKAHFLAKKINYKVKYEQNFEGDLILLDIPGEIENSTSGHYLNHRSQSFHTYLKSRKSSVDAYSYLSMTKQKMDKAAQETYLQLPGFIPANLKNVAKAVKDKSPRKILENFERFIKQNKFSYSLSPGIMPSMSIFLDKKIGFCGHYSSLLAIILRYLDIPSRVVTGFQGGTYLGDEKIAVLAVKNQDAHAWVEYYENGTWKRVDPTSFIAPDRVLQSTNFSSDGKLEARKLGFFSRAFYSARQVLAKLDYKLTAFFDEFNRNYQKSLAEKLKLSLTIFYILGGLLLVLAATITILLFKRRNKKYIHKLDKDFLRFLKKLEKRGITTQAHDGLGSIAEKIHSLPPEKISEATAILKTYEVLRYSKKDMTGHRFSDQITRL